MSSPVLSGNDIANSVIIIMSFIAVWTFVFAIVGVQELWKYGKDANDKKKVKVDTNIVAGGSDSAKNISVAMKVS
jgi:hypothetical protein